MTALEIYIDVIFIENFVINYLVLYVTSLLGKIKTSLARMLAGALTGALYAVLSLLLPSAGVFLSIIIKIAVSLLMVCLSYKTEKIVQLFKYIVFFYISAFIFAGVSVAYTYVTSGNPLIDGLSGIYRLNMPGVFIAIFIAVMLIKFFAYIYKLKLDKDSLLVRVIIGLEGRTATLCALVDTGNTLVEPLTGSPVIVAELEALYEILPMEIINICKMSTEKNDQLYSLIALSDIRERLRIIPFTSIGRENGIMIGFKPDHVEINGDRGSNCPGQIVVGISNTKLSKKGMYRALLSPELI